MIYIFHGPDDFTRNEKVEELRQAMGDPTVAALNETVLAGPTTAVKEISSNAGAMPFMADRRLVIVTGFLSAHKSKSSEIEQLAAYLPQIPETTDLVLVEPETIDRRNPILKAANGLQAQVIKFAGPDKKNVRVWIIERAREHDAVIEASAAELLGQLVGTDLRTLDNELEKLAIYAGSSGQPIRRVDVQLLVPYITDSENFGLTNAIGQRNAQQAYDQLHKLLGEDKHPMMILAMIATQIRGLLQVKDMAERGMSPQEIARHKGWRSDFAAKMRLREAANFSLARLEEILELLLSIDLDIKTGRIDNELVLDVLVARLCAGPSRR